MLKMMVHTEQVKRSDDVESCYFHGSTKSALPFIKRAFQNQRHGVFCTIMSKPPTIIYKRSVLTEAWNRNSSSLYHVYWQKQECYGVNVITLLLWVALVETGREASLISIYPWRITVSIQYLFHSGVHWLHLYSLWWLANWAVPVA